MKYILKLLFNYHVFDATIDKRTNKLSHNQLSFARLLTIQTNKI